MLHARCWYQVLPSPAESISGSEEEVAHCGLQTLILRHLRDSCCSHFLDVVTEAQPRLCPARC